MARARNIKPGFFKNEELGECRLETRLAFIGLWLLADREGRVEDRPKRIKGELFPFDAFDVEPLLAELERSKFIVRYRNDDGRFIQIVNFAKHQSPHYTEKPSVIKPPELPETTQHEGARTRRALPEGSESVSPIKTGSLPPDSLIHRFTDSPNPDSPNPDSLNPEDTHTADLSKTAPSNVEAVCLLLRELGFQVSPTNPKLIALCGAGASLDEFREAAEMATEKDKRTIGYVVGIVANRREEAGKLQSLNHAPQKRWSESLAETARQLRTPCRIFDGVATRFD
jgi:hypothetical protein